MLGTEAEVVDAWEDDESSTLRVKLLRDVAPAYPAGELVDFHQYEVELYDQNVL